MALVVRQPQNIDPHASKREQLSEAANRRKVDEEALSQMETELSENLSRCQDENPQRITDLETTRQKVKAAKEKMFQDRQELIREEIDEIESHGRQDTRNVLSGVQSSSSPQPEPFFSIPIVGSNYSIAFQTKSECVLCLLGSLAVGYGVAKALNSK